MLKNLTRIFKRKNDKENSKESIVFTPAAKEVTEKKTNNFPREAELVLKEFLNVFPEKMAAQTQVNM